MKELFIPFMSSLNQLADILTKGISSKMFKSTVCKLVMIDIHQLEGGC